MRGGQIHTRDSSLGSASRTRYDRQIETVPGKFTLGSMPVNRAVEKALALRGGFLRARAAGLWAQSGEGPIHGRRVDYVGLREPAAGRGGPPMPDALHRPC